MEGWYVADMQGSALVDTVLYVLNDLGQEIVCNDDISLDRASRVMFRAAAGQRFFLVADGYSRIQVHIAREPPGDPPQVQLNLGRMPSECPDFELTPGRPFSRTQPFVSGGTMQHRPSRLEGTCGGAPQAEVTWSFTPHTTGFWRFLATGGAVQVLRGRCSNTPMTDCGMIEPVWLEQGQEVTVVMRGRSPDQAISFSLDVEGPAVCGDHQCTEWAGESLSTCCQDCR